MADALYPRLLGSSWSQLDSAVQGLHCRGEGLRAAGVFRVSCGCGLGARFVNGLLRMPSQADRAAVMLVVTPDAFGERWSRTIGGRSIETFQRELPGGLLGERFGILEFQFQLKVVDRAVYYRQMRVNLLPFGIPLPCWASPRVTAREDASGVWVELAAPVVGFLFRYEGKVMRVAEV